jgi:diguanylate cyclase (GGDEF)-like protein
VSSEAADGDQHHFSGSYTRALIDFLHDELGVAGTDEVLASAGETRGLDVLTDEGSWNSYDVFRRLLEEAGRAFGGPDALVGAGIQLQAASDADLTWTVRALGSPEALFTNVAAANAAISTLVHLSSVEVAPQEWLIEQRFSDGFAPFAEYCALATGLHQLGARLFGYPDVSAVEEQCVRHGDPACVFRVRWALTDEPVRRANLLEKNVHALERRMERFEDTVADLISGEDLQAVLTRTFISASQAVRAPMWLLTLDIAPKEVRRIYSTGVPSDDLERLTVEVRAAELEQSSAQLIVEVASTRRRYGRLAAIRPAGGFLPQEIPKLKAYAGFLAAALDSAIALDEAHALLELSTALAEITSAQEMAVKLVRAVPLVMGCDHAVVLLPAGAAADGSDAGARIVAVEGYPPHIAQTLIGRTVAVPDGWNAPIESYAWGRVDPAGVLAGSGTSGAIAIPIVVEGVWAGAIVAGVTGEFDPLRVGSGAEERLRGLAGQAASAIRNAHLLDQVRHQALHDPLTGLPNRTLILDRAEQLISHGRRSKNPGAAMFVDLDGFKDVNDTFGHATGDALLIAVTARVRSTLRLSDTIGRLGGDEFVVLIEGAQFDVGPELVAERLLEILREPFHLPGHPAPLSVTASIGIAAGDRATAGDLLRDADTALYQAKAAGKDCYRVFEPEMHTTLQENLLLQMDLHTALDAGQFFLVYQPICNLASGEITSVEALIRWQHPTRGVIQPDDFVPILEQTGGILEVGRWVLFEACRQASRWRARGFHLDMSVNVSRRQLHADRLIVDVRESLAATGLPAEHLVLEITETTMMSDVEASAGRLSLLRALGVRIAVDDFGTGYSSLAVLRTLPVDTLKIDSAFVAGLGGSIESNALIHTLMQLGRALGLDTVAEGIEEWAQYDQLKGERCNSGQGFLIARPALAAELECVLRGPRLGA